MKRPDATARTGQKENWMETESLSKHAAIYVQRKRLQLVTTQSDILKNAQAADSFLPVGIRYQA